MLLRSSSTGVLASLVSTVGAHADGGFSDFSPAGHAGGNSSIPSTPTNAHLSSNKAGDDARSVEGGDWNFESGSSAVPWPRFRKVQSESDLQSLCRSSSSTAACFAAADSLMRAPASVKKPELENNHVESFPGSGRKPWARRTKTGGLRRGSSLTVIPSARHMEIDDTIAELAESLTPQSTVGDSDEFSESPRSVINRSSSYRWQYMDQPILNASKTPQSSGPSTCSPTVETGTNSDWEYVGEENSTYVYMSKSGVVTSLSAEFASFSGRQHIGELNMAVAVEAPKSGAVFNSQRNSVAQKDLFGPMFITDLGIGNGGNGGIHKVSGGGSEGGNGETRGAEAHYRKMLETDPNNALLLRNYAKFLHEVLKDPHRAEVYYERAILANPTDGEVLGAYAKLIWDVYKDEDRAGRYFDQALEANPDDCYLNAAYAAFLWSSEDPEDPPEDNCHNDLDVNLPTLSESAAAASA